MLDKLLSDHFSIFAVRKKEKEKVCKKWKNIRINKNFDRDIFCTLLQYYDWTVCYASRDVDVLWNNIFSNMTEILEVMCPYKRVGLPYPMTPWINAEVIKAINERKKYMRLYWKTKKQFIWEICKYMHNRCNSLIRSAKARYIKNNLLRSTVTRRGFRNHNLLKGPKERLLYTNL